MNYGYGNYGASGFLAAFFAIYVVVLGSILVLALVVYVLNGFAFMALFRKVGIEPWAAWVPYFNIWRILELGGQPGWISLVAFVPQVGGIVSVVFECIATYRISHAFRKGGEWVVLFIFLPFVWAWLLASDKETYEPGLFAQHGWSQPLVGHGSARGPYTPSTYPAPPAPPAPPAA